MAEQQVTVKLEVKTEGAGIRALQTMREEMRKVKDEAQGIGEQSRDAKKMMNGLTDQTASVKTLGRSYQELAEETDGAARRAIKSHQQQITEIKKQDEAVSKQIEKYRSFQDKARSGFEAAGGSAVRFSQGVMDVTQGFMQMGIASEENIEKLARKLVYVDGIFRTFKGTIDLTFGGINAIRQFGEAMTSWDKAKFIGGSLGMGRGSRRRQRRGRDGQDGGGGGYGTGSFIGDLAVEGAVEYGAERFANRGGRAAGRAGRAGRAARMAGRGGRLTGLARGAMGFAGNAGRAAIPLAGMAAKGLGMGAVALGGGLAIHDIVKESLFAMGLTKSGGAIREGIDYKKESENVDASNNRVSAAERKLQEQRAAFATEEDNRARAGAYKREQRNSAVGLFQMENQLTAKDDTEANVRERQAAYGELASTVQQMDQVEQANAERLAQRKRQSIAEQIDAVTNVRVAVERTADAERGRLGIAQQMIAKLKAQHDQIKAQIESAKSRIEQESDAVESKEARFAKMSQTDQARLKELAAKKNSGVALSKADALFLEGTGFGAKDAQKTLADDARKSGVGSVIQAFGEDAGLTEAQKKLAELEKKKVENAAETAKQEGEETVAKKRYLELMRQRNALIEKEQKLEDTQAGKMLDQSVFDNRKDGENMGDHWTKYLGPAGDFGLGIAANRGTDQEELKALYQTGQAEQERYREFEQNRNLPEGSGIPGGRLYNIGPLPSGQLPGQGSTQPDNQQLIEQVKALTAQLEAGGNAQQLKSAVGELLGAVEKNQAAQVAALENQQARSTRLSQQS